jgi:hypothetical protein
MEDQSLVVLSALLDSLMLQQGFTGADYQHAKELFQPSLASCEKPPGYAAKLDVVDTYDLLEYRASVLTECPRPAACVNSRDGLHLALSVAVKLMRGMLFG